MGSASEVTAMRVSNYLTVITAFFTILSSGAQAASFWDYLFTPDVPDTTRYYKHRSNEVQMAIHEMDEWTPEVWTQNGGGRKSMMDKLYFNGIITDQYIDDGVPVLEVGQHFMELSSNDKRRVVAYVDSVFGITQSHESGTIILNHWQADEPVGIYTREGLQLQ
jgi:hypothetical protein